jgi:hypothetical protein
MNDRYQMNDDDNDLLRALDELFTDTDPIPEHLSNHARALFDLGGLDAELAVLSDEAGALVLRSPADPIRVVTFTSERVSIELESLPDGMLAGLVAPPLPAIVRLQTPNGSTVAPLDHVGNFSIRRPGGQFRILVELDHGAVVTPWIEFD